ncbi:Zn(II)2Cys6 transcription factor domain-containing protein [Aspergillus mulundensis]|uniref:Zn(2)-C6 fungal-type domain-containing protein n=1 Tax=Aspergillus mulundensis TaxID=1810919 RepID=A0A3D8SBD0_9EURO|nr:hypothetical protein DSM5745_03899 [Aspergillus mulundensis]RDW83573.1 hypothetical protein DSM5745_03899 [Aspergillus mulundensis]
MDGRGPYGLACVNCAKGKVKCVAMGNGEGCQRCHRLKKPCEPSQGIRKRESQNFNNPLMEEIDAKLDSVLELLQSAHLSPAPQPLLPQFFHRTPTPKLSGSSSSQANSTPTPQLPPATIPYEIPGDRDAEEALNLFRGRMLRLCPFVYLPPNLTPQQMQRERPFLFETMLAVTTRSIQEKIARGKEFKKALATAMVVENESSIDLLLGILTYVAWGYDQHVNRQSTLSRLMEMAVSIVHCLHLNKPAPSQANTLTLFGGSHSWPKIHYSTINPLEEKRAVLGCFLLASVISSYFEEMEPMRWTPMIEGYLKVVEENYEWSGDTALAAHVRLQLLAQRARQFRDEQETPISVPFFLKSFRPQLEVVRNALPSGAKKDDWILGHLHYVELAVHETAYSAQDAAPAPVGTVAPSVSPIGPDAIGCMWHSLQAIRSWWEVFHRYQTEDITLFTMFQWIQFARALVTLFRLSTHPAPDWDHEAVRKSTDILKIMDHVEWRLEQLCPDNNEAFPDDIFARLQFLARAMRAWTQMQFEGRGTQTDPEPEAEPEPQPQPQPQPTWEQMGGGPLVEGVQPVQIWNAPPNTIHVQPLQFPVQYNDPGWANGLVLPSQSPTAGMQF